MTWCVYDGFAHEAQLKLNAHCSAEHAKSELTSWQHVHVPWDFMSIPWCCARHCTQIKATSDVRVDGRRWGWGESKKFTITKRVKISKLTKYKISKVFESNTQSSSKTRVWLVIVWLQIVYFWSEVISSLRPKVSMLPLRPLHLEGSTRGDQERAPLTQIWKE